MSGHTPAPWTVMPEEDGCDDMTLVSCERCGIAMVYRGPVEEGFVVVKAGKVNARLIAAAPELLEACLQWQRLFVDFADEVKLQAKGLPAQITAGDAIEKTKAAIAKAEGR